MKDVALMRELALHVHAIQKPILGSAREHFKPSQVEHLRDLVRLAVEFHYQVEPNPSASTDELNYVADSILAGVDSFVLVRDAYSVRGGEPSAMKWHDVSLHTLTAAFSLRYDEFIHEVDFMRQCRLVLDLFNIQLVFAAIYGR